MGTFLFFSSTPHPILRGRKSENEKRPHFSKIGRGQYVLAFILVSLGTLGCGSSWDRGYEDALDGSKKSVLRALLSGDYREGYEAGQRGFQDYAEGCDDARSETPKQRFDSDEYDDGYSDCL